MWASHSLKVWSGDRETVSPPDMEYLAGRDFCCWKCLVHYVIEQARWMGEWPAQESQSSDAQRLPNGATDLSEHAWHARGLRPVRACPDCKDGQPCERARKLVEGS